METFDVVVIGGGPGGYPAAIRAAQLGASTALVEKESLGGTCLNWGCIPTKTLIASSDLYARVRQGAKLGLKVGSASFDYGQMVRRKDEVVTRLRGGIAGLLKAHGVKVYEGVGSFAERGVVEVAGSGGATRLSARKTIVASGSVSAVPGFIPRHERVMESRAFLGLTSLPTSLVVLGGGVIGCEFACMAAQLGVQVTVVEMLEDILMLVDGDVRSEVRRHMERELGIQVLTGKPLQNIEAGSGGVSGTVGDGKVSGDLLLVAVGRRPLTDGLKPAAAGVRVSASGHIEVDDCGLTTAAGVYAIGDATAAGPQLAHSATSQGVIAAENAVKGGRRKFDKLVPSCIFTAPEIGSVGLTEQQAAAQGIAYKTGKFTFAALGKALAQGETGGFVKWVVRSDNDQLLGAHAVGAHATELISEAAVAIRCEMTASELGRTIHCHPTLSESWMEAAHAVHGECIHAAPVRKRQA